MTVAAMLHNEYDYSILPTAVSFLDFVRLQIVLHFLVAEILVNRTRKWQKQNVQICLTLTMTIVFILLPFHSTNPLP